MDQQVDHILFTSTSYASLASQVTLTDEDLLQAKESQLLARQSSPLTDQSIHWQAENSKQIIHDSKSEANDTAPEDRPTNAALPFQEQAHENQALHRRYTSESNIYCQSTGSLARENSIITVMSIRDDIPEKFPDPDIVKREKNNTLGHSTLYNNAHRPMPNCPNVSTLLTTPSGVSPGQTADSSETLTLYEKKQKLILLLGQCLLQSGCPCHRTQDALEQTSQKIGVNVSFSILPDAVLVSFANQSSVMIKSPQGIDMGKIGHVNHIMNDYLGCDSDPYGAALDTCLQKLQSIASGPPTWGIIGTCTSFAVSSFSASLMLFNGSWIDASASAFLGLLVGIMFILSIRFRIYGPVFEMSACILVSVLTRALQSFCCFTSVVLSAVLILLPGYSMTISVLELSAHHITTGIIRLLHAVFYAFILAYGFQMGNEAYSGIASAVSPKNGEVSTISDVQDNEDALCGKSAISTWFYIGLMPLLSISISMSYGSSPRQWAPQFGGAVIGFCLSFFLNRIIPDAPIVDSMTAFAIGLYACLVLKLTNEPPLITLAVGVTLLVPGSIGVRGAYALLHQDDLSRSIFPIQMLIVALGLSTGLFAAAMIVYPSGKKKSLFISL